MADEKRKTPAGEPAEQQLGRYRIAVLLCGAFCCFVAGTCYLYGVLQPHIMEHFGVDSALASTPFTFCFVFMVLGEFAASPLQKHLGAKFTATLGLALMGVGYFACSILKAGDVGLLVFFYSVLLGMGLGIVYNVVAAVSVRWFPDHKGVATSVSLGMMGAAGIVLSPVLGACLENEGLQTSLRYLCLLTVPCIVFVLAVFKDIPPGYMADYKPTGVVGRQTAARESSGLRDLVRTRDAWMLVLLYFSLVPAFLIASSVFVSFGSAEKQLAQQTAVWFVSAAAIAQIVGRFTLPSLSDRIGRRAAFFIVLALMVSSLALLVLSTGYVYAAAFCLFSFAYGGGVTSMPAIISDRLGSANAALNIAFAELGTLLGSVVSTALVNALATGPSLIVSGVGSCMLGVVALCVIYAKGKKRTVA